MKTVFFLSIPIPKDLVPNSSEANKGDETFVPPKIHMCFVGASKEG